MHRQPNLSTSANRYFLDSPCYLDSDLCTQAQLSVESETGQHSVLSRMENLRAFARVQRNEKLKAEGMQTSFCF
ncbi:MAG: hypothetical protein ABJH06_06305 [Paraglaciecola sp.]|uniref:hypothetical protein n=1 Tax=Paraglaciecola sp. TaxID=1920173 RepID=UPI003265C336